MRALSLLAAFVAGILALAAARFLFAAPEPATHHHANFALFVDGDRVDLSADRYMEDVGACSLEPGVVTPRERVHMHANEDHVVHVHHPGVSWGHFFQNLGMSLGSDYLVLDDGRMLASDSIRTLKFVLNGQPVGALAGEAIRSGDRALISFGPAPVAQILETQFPQVAEDARDYNEESDPATCRGHGEAGTLERVRAAFWR